MNEILTPEKERKRENNNKRVKRKPKIAGKQFNNGMP